MSFSNTDTLGESWEFLGSLGIPERSGRAQEVLGGLGEPWEVLGGRVKSWGRSWAVSGNWEMLRGLGKFWGFFGLLGGVDGLGKYWEVLRGPGRS